jgi:hypothetical protein
LVIVIFQVAVVHFAILDACTLEPVIEKVPAVIHALVIVACCKSEFLSIKFVVVLEVFILEVEYIVL